LPFRGNQLRFKWPRIDLGQHIPGMNDLSFHKIDFRQLPADLTRNAHCRQRRHHAERLDIDSNVSLLGGDRGSWNSGWRGYWLFAAKNGSEKKHDEH